MLSTTMAPLGRNQRWITWSLEPNPKRPDKPRKLPRSPFTGDACSVTDPSTWAPYDVALAAAQARGHGLGYVFAEGDGFFFLDIDNCWDAGTGQWSPLAQHLMSVWQGHAAVEVSQSGTGLHIFGYASQMPPHSCRNVLLGMELYHAERFAAFTDHQSFGAIDADVSGLLASVANAYFPPSTNSRDLADWVEEGDGASADDADLLRIMLHSGQNTFGARFGDSNVAFCDLWEANAEALAKRWPSQHDAFDRSSADSALAGHLIYWCGGNCERVERFMRQSALMRDKWDHHTTYMERTILGAAGTVKNRATPRDIGEPVLPSEAKTDRLIATVSRDLEVRTGASFLSFEEQRKYFKDCVYLTAPSQVWHPRISVLMDKQRFDILFGGKMFTFTEEKTTKSAWEAFTQSHGVKPTTARNTCFRPWMATGEIMEELLNIYVPIETARTVGDASKFERHIRLLLPRGDDAAILLTYMARVVRSPGFKAQWWPVIQGCQGNGKSLLNLVMIFAIGERYAHQARASSMAKTGLQFNSWVSGNLYLGVEEIQVADKRHFLEDFKDIVTNRVVATEAKGQDQRVSDNCLNGMMFTNHLDAVPITEEDRRYAIFYCMQQVMTDLALCGMDASYFTDLYDWMYGRAAYADLGANYGFRVVNEWLRTADIIDARYDPAGAATRAPQTSATANALVQSRGTIEQDILEAIATGETGWAGGWVSGAALDLLLTRHRVRLPHTKRHVLMQSLGYSLHPSLPGGRSVRPVAGSASKALLYLCAGHTALGLTDPEAIALAFDRAQGMGVGNAAAVALLGR